MTIFGQVIDGSQVEDIVENFLQRWLPVYLAELAEQRALPRDTWLKTGPQGNWPPSWSRKSQFDYTEETRLPSVQLKNVASSLDGPVLPDDPPPDPTTPYEDWPILEDIDHVHIDVKETP
jgi:hypothetical protein